MHWMKTSFLVIPVLLLALTACGPPVGTPEESGVVNGLPVPVETAVKEALSARTGVPVEEIDVVAAEAVDWQDACLGLPDEDEVCAQVVTPGWKVTLRAGGEAYVIHTNGDGSAIRMEE